MYCRYNVSVARIQQVLQRMYSRYNISVARRYSMCTADTMYLWPGGTPCVPQKQFWRIALLSLYSIVYHVFPLAASLSPMRELITPVMVSSLLLPAFAILSLLLYSRFPSTFLPSKIKSISTSGTRWHDFFLHTFLDIL